MRKRLTETRYGTGERGTALIEASLTLMLFLMIVFSLFDFGLSLYLQQSIMHQARTGARYGAINPDPVAIKNMVLYGRPTDGTGTGLNGLVPSSVTVTRQGTPTTASDRIVVTITGYNFTWITPGWAGNKTAKPIIMTMPVEY